MLGVRRLFGLLCAYKPELKIKDFESYQAVYCGLCKEISKSCGGVARLNLSYDLVFLAMLGMAAEGGAPELKKGRCMLNPFRRKCYYIRSQALTYTAYMGVLLTYGKLRDNVADERWTRSLGSRLALIPYSLMKRRAARAYPELSEMIQEKLAGLSRAEWEKNATLDGYADYFASLLSGVFSHITQDAPTSRIFGEAGYFAGKWIYLMDAWIDLKQDLEEGRFNPYAVCLGREEPAEELAARLRPQVETMLQDTMVRLCRACELLDMGRFKPVLDNILYLSMERRMQERTAAEPVNG